MKQSHSYKTVSEAQEKKMEDLDRFYSVDCMFLCDRPSYWRKYVVLTGKGKRKKRTCQPTIDVLNASLYHFLYPHVLLDSSFHIFCLSCARVASVLPRHARSRGISVWGRPDREIAPN